MSSLSALAGCRLQRIDGPHRDLLALTFHRADLHGVLLLATPTDRAAWGWVPERPRGEPASAFVLLLRKHLSNATLIDITTAPSGGVVTLRRGDATLALHLTRAPANVLLLEDGRFLGARSPARAREAGARIGEPFEPPAVDGSAGGPALAPDLEALVAHGPELAGAIFGADDEARRRALLLGIARRRRKLERRLRAIEADLERVDEVPRLREQASLLLAHLRTIPAGATVATVTDWHADPPAPIEIPISEGRSAREEADALYKKARKLERGAEIAMGRHAQTESELARLDELGRDAQTAEDLTPLERRARNADAAPAAAPRASSAAPERRPYREFRGFRGRPIWVGRSAADNDALTLRCARPWDWWLHARGVPGSHVVVPLDKNESCPGELLVDAAHLAAFHSDARGESPIEIQHLARRYVRKPRGAAPGAVTVEREAVLLLRIDPDRLEALLASEER